METRLGSIIRGRDTVTIKVPLDEYIGGPAKETRLRFHRRRDCRRIKGCRNLAIELGPVHDLEVQRRELIERQPVANRQPRYPEVQAELRTALFLNHPREFAVVDTIDELLARADFPQPETPPFDALL